MKNILIVLILVSILFAEECSVAKPCPGDHYCAGGICRKKIWLNSSIIILAIAFGLTAIVYAIGVVLDHPRIINWSKNEIYELSGTAFILALFFSSLLILDNLIGPAFYSTSIAYPGEIKRGEGTWASVEGHAKWYIGKIKDDVKEIFKTITTVSLWGGFITSLMINIKLDVVGIFLSPFAVFGSVIQMLPLVAGAMIAAVAQLEIQYKLIEYSGAMFSIFLPLGVALRAFPVTRAAGGALIAIAAGFNILLPITYLLIYDVSDHYYRTYCGGRPSGSGIIMEFLGSGIIGSIGDVARFNEMIQREFSPTGYFGCLGYLIVLEATMLPLFAYLIMLNITRHLAEIMGAHIDFSAIVRFI